MLDKILHNPINSLLIIILGIVTLHALYRFIVVKGDDLYEQLKVRWTSLEAVTVTITIYFWSQVLAAVPLVMVFREQVINQETIPIKFITILTIDVVAISLLYRFLRRRGARLKDIGLKRPILKDLGYVLAGYGVYIVIYLVLVQIVSGLPGFDVNQKQEIGFKPGMSGDLLWLVFLSLAVLPAITEEVIMRGFLYTGLRSKFTMIKAGLITSLIFAVAHLQAGSGNALLWIAGIDTFVLSMVLVYLREKTGSLAAPIGLHMLKNGIAFVYLFILKIPLNT